MSAIEINQCHFIYFLWMHYNYVKYMFKTITKSVPEVMPLPDGYTKLYKMDYTNMDYIALQDGLYEGNHLLLDHKFYNQHAFERMQTRL